MVTIDEDMNKVARSVDSDWNIVTPERVSKAFNMNTCSVPQIITCVISYNFLIQKLWSFHSLNKKLMLWWFGPPLPYQWQWWWGFFLYHYSRLSIHLTIINKHTWNNETLSSKAFWTLVSIIRENHIKTQLKENNTPKITTC